jgi:myo-inositol-1(or 4)-monophosphatase
VAAGRLDGFWQPSMFIWDVASGAIIVEEAGGRVSDFSGSGGVYEGHIIASNGKIHDALVEVIHNR